MGKGVDPAMDIKLDDEVETMAQAMALFVTYVEETWAEPEKRSEAYKQLLLDIADETWGFPNAFHSWRTKKDSERLEFIAFQLPGCE